LKEYRVFGWIQTKEVFDYYLEKLFQEYAGYHTDLTSMRCGLFV
jgi:hypothetical protein